jgi:hypothetical protein
MTWSPDLTVTGAAQTGFTTPTYTLVADLAPDVSSRQWVVTACGGTQTGARVSTAGDPFTLTIRRSPYKPRPIANPVNGSYGNVPMNRIEVLGRKGVYIDSANTIREARIRLIAELPAGSESTDAVNIRALASMFLGQVAEEAADYGDSLISAVI